MQATDVMTSNIVAVQADTSVREIAGLLLKHRISAVPVVDSEQRVLGIVSEGDLMRRPESDTSTRHSWWLDAFVSPDDKAGKYIKTHGLKAGDVMTQNVVTVTEDTPLHEIAWILEKRHIKRVPVIRDERLVGIVSRANLLHGLAAEGAKSADPGSEDDRLIREKLVQTLSKEAGLDTGAMNVIVSDRIVQLWGVVKTRNEKKAAQIAAENTSGVKAVENNLGQVPAWIWGA